MSKNKLIEDMNMHPEVIDLCEDEDIVVNLKDETLNISLEQSKTETNNGERKNLMKKENAPEINWDLLEIESDYEQAKSLKESQKSDNSVLLLEAGSDSVPFSSRDKDINMIEGDSLVLNMEGERENGDMKGLSQSIVVSSNESMVSLENMRVQMTLVNNVTNENREGLILSSEYSSVIIDAVKKCESEKTGQLDLSSEHKLRDINSVVGLNENSDSGTSPDLKVSSSISVVHSIESEDNLEKLDFVSIFPKKDARGDEYVEGAYGNVDVVLQGSANCEVLPKDVEAQDMGDEVDHEKLNLEGRNANSSVVGGDSDMNCLELTLYTSVQDTPVSACQAAEINRDQTDLELALRNVLEIKTFKRRGRPRKEKKNMIDANAGSALVVCNIGESSSSRRKRVRRESKYLSFPYTSTNEGSPKRPRKEDKKVKKGADDKAERSAKEVLLDLIAAAQSPMNPENSIPTKPTRGLVISFRDSLSSKDYKKTSQEVAVASSPVLVDARGKLEDIIMSLSGSDVESKKILIRDARGLLEKVNLALTKDGTVATEV